MIVDANCDWDEEDISNAIEQAQQIEEWDAEAAKHLRAQAAWVKQQLQGTANIREPYDPMALQARVLRGYNGGVTDACLAHMDYRRFFGLVRELEIMIEDERKEYDKARGTQNNNMEAMAALNGLPQPEEYTGETIRLI